MNIKYYIAKFLTKLNFPAINKSTIHKTAKIYSGAAINNCTIGKYSYVGVNTRINYTKIGNFNSIAGNCHIGGGSHSTIFVSTSPVFIEGYNAVKYQFYNHQYEQFKETEIGSDVWIGAGAFIKSGITINSGAVIGMGSVVTKDVGAYEIWAGNPARLIRKRFDDYTIEKLIESQWWDWTDNDIRYYSPYFNNPEEFIKYYEEKKRS